MREIFSRAASHLAGFAEETMAEPTEVRRLITYTDENGLERTNWQTVATVLSWGTPLSQREALIANQVDYRVDGSRYLPRDTDVLPTDYLRVGGESGKVYEVAGIQEGTPEYMTGKVVLVTRRD